ncbi:MAG: OmpA family protein [Propionivibrio sp.]
MFFQTNLRSAIAAFGALLLVASCANQETQPTGQTNKTSVATTVSTTQNGVRPIPPVPVENVLVEIPNPVIIEFDKTSVELDDAAKRMIAQIAEKAEGSQKLVIWGYCDRAQIANAAKAAIARAIAVRKELQANGVKSPTVRIRYSVEEPNRHAAEVHFD